MWWLIVVGAVLIVIALFLLFTQPSTYSHSKGRREKTHHSSDWTFIKKIPALIAYIILSPFYLCYWIFNLCVQTFRKIKENSKKKQTPLQPEEEYQLSEAVIRRIQQRGFTYRDK